MVHTKNTKHMESIRLDCTQTAQLFIVNESPESVWQGIAPNGRRLYFVLVAAQPAPDTPGVDKLVDSLPLATVVSLAAQTSAAMPAPEPRPRVSPPPVSPKPAQAPRPVRPATTPPPAAVSSLSMHPALRMRLERAVAVLNGKKGDQHDRQQALTLLRTNRSRLTEISGAEECLRKDK